MKSGTIAKHDSAKINRVWRVMESGLSSGEDSEEEEAAPVGFEENISDQNGWKVPKFHQYH
jgi:hypothetical protein